jgi:hypothetical protein
VRNRDARRAVDALRHTNCFKKPNFGSSANRLALACHVEIDGRAEKSFLCFAKATTHNEARGERRARSMGRKKKRCRHGKRKVRLRGV